MRYRRSLDNAKMRVINCTDCFFKFGEKIEVIGKVERKGIFSFKLYGIVSFYFYGFRTDCRVRKKRKNISRYLEKKLKKNKITFFVLTD